MRIAVVGAGLIGMGIATSLVSAGHSAILLSRRRPIKDWAGPPWYSVNPLAADLPQFDTVVHAGGYAAPRMTDQDLESLLPAALSQLDVSIDIAARRRCGLLLISSGGSVYGRLASPARESSMTKPESPYGKLKLAEERHLAASGLELASSLRVSNVYGRTAPRDQSQGLVWAALRAARSSSELQLFANLANLRDYIWLGDLATAVAELSTVNEWPSAINIGSGRASSIQDVIEGVERVTGLSIAVTGADEHMAAEHFTLDTGLVEALITWRPISLQTGLSRLVD